MTSLPVDMTPDRLSVEVHYYSSWQFCGMENDESWGKAFYFWGEENKNMLPERMKADGIISVGKII